jgi:hypothetical protein
MQAEEMLKVLSIDNDPTLFDAFLEKTPQFTTRDILNYLPYMFYLNPAVRWEVDNFANRLSENINGKDVKAKNTAKTNSNHNVKSKNKTRKLDL